MSVRLLLALAALSQAVTFFTCSGVALEKVQNSSLLLKTPIKVKKKKKKPKPTNPHTKTKPATQTPPVQFTQMKTSDLHRRRVDPQMSVGRVL